MSVLELLSVLLTLFEYLLLLFFFLFCLMWIIGSTKHEKHHRQQQQIYHYPTPQNHFNNPYNPISTPKTPPIHGPPLPPRKLSFSTTPRQQRHVTFHLTPEQERNERDRERRGLLNALNTPPPKFAGRVNGKRWVRRRGREGMRFGRREDLGNEVEDGGGEKDVPLVELFPVEDDGERSRRGVGIRNRRKSLGKKLRSPRRKVLDGAVKKVRRDVPTRLSVSKVLEDVGMDGSASKLQSTSDLEARVDRPLGEAPRRALQSGSDSETRMNRPLGEMPKRNVQSDGDVEERMNSRKGKFGGKLKKLTSVTSPISKRRWKTSFLDKPVSHATMKAWKQSKIDAETRIVQILTAANGSQERATQFAKTLEEHKLRANEAADREAKARSLAKSSEIEEEVAKKGGVQETSSLPKHVRFNLASRENDPPMPANGVKAVNFGFSTQNGYKAHTGNEESDHVQLLKTGKEPGRSEFGKNGQTAADMRQTLSSNAEPPNFGGDSIAPTFAPKPVNGTMRPGGFNPQKELQQATDQQKQAFKLDLNMGSQTPDVWSKKEVFNFGNAASKQAGTFKFGTSKQNTEPSKGFSFG